MNRVSLVGRLVRDPEIQVTNSNIKYARFTIAVDRPFINQQTNRPQTDFIPVVTWRNQAEFMEKFLDKGSLIAVEGYFSTSNYQGESGQMVWRHEVTADRISALETKSQSENRRRANSDHVGTNTSSNQGLKFENANVEKEQVNESSKEQEESIPWELDLD